MTSGSSGESLASVSDCSTVRRSEASDKSFVTAAACFFPNVLSTVTCEFATPPAVDIWLFAKRTSAW